MTAAVLRPFHWSDDFLTYELPVRDGLVQRDTGKNITKFAIVDRFSGTKSVSKMFWVGTGMLPVNNKAATRNDINNVGSSSGLMTVTPSDASVDEMVPGDIATAKAFGKRVAEATAMLV